MKLRDVVPIEFKKEFYDSKAYKYIDTEVIVIHSRSYLKNMKDTSLKWIGKEKYIYVWWELKNGYAIGWNENPAKGWSFPVRKLK